MQHNPEFLQSIQLTTALDQRAVRREQGAVRALKRVGRAGRINLSLARQSLWLGLQGYGHSRCGAAVQSRRRPTDLRHLCSRLAAGGGSAPLSGQTDPSAAATAPTVDNREGWPHHGRSKHAARWF